MLIFPTCTFAPNGVDADLARRTVSGGVALSGAEDLIGTDGGGRVTLEFQDFYLDDPAVAGAYRALSTLSDGGVTPFFVPFCDARHQPTNGRVSVPHSDGASFSDESEYQQGDASAVTAAAAPLRATTITLTGINFPRPLHGGEWFSIDHPTYRHRAYRVGMINGDSITFRPPLREAVPAGTPLNFADPLCTMRVDGDMRSGSTLGYAEAPSLRFVEHFPGPEGYTNG